MKTYEEYLQEVHASAYMGTDDNMLDDYQNWLGEKDHDDMMDLAETYGSLMFKKGRGSVTQEDLDARNFIDPRDL